MKLMKWQNKDIISILLVLLYAVSGYGQEENLCSAQVKDSIVCMPESYKINRNLTDNIVLKFNSDNVFSNYPNIIYVENKLNECLKVSNAHFFKLEGYENLIVITPNRFSKTVSITLNDTTDSVEFSVKARPYVQFELLIGKEVLHSTDSILQSEFKSSKLSYRIFTRPDYNDLCLENFIKEKYAIKNIQFAFIRNDKILVENEGRNLDDLFLRVKRKIRRGDILVFDIYLKNCEPLLYRIKIK